MTTATAKYNLGPQNTLEDVIDKFPELIGPLFAMRIHCFG